MMQRITREQSRKYAFDWEDEALLRVKCGESFEIETYDASTGYFQSEKNKAIPALRPGFDRTPPQANPIGGPVWLEGAERGDTLVITIEDIVVGDYSWIAIGPKRGSGPDPFLAHKTGWSRLGNRLWPALGGVFPSRSPGSLGSGVHRRLRNPDGLLRRRRRGQRRLVVSTAFFVFGQQRGGNP